MTALHDILRTRLEQTADSLPQAAKDRVLTGDMEIGVTIPSSVLVALLGDAAQTGPDSESPAATSGPRTPAEHYALADALLVEAGEASLALAGLTFGSDPGSIAQLHASQTAIGHRVAAAQAHAILATVPANQFAPVIVSAPAELLDRVKVVDPSAASRGVVFIPDEIAGGELGSDDPFADRLVQAMATPTDGHA